MSIPTDGLVLYLPLYSTDLTGTPITSKDSYSHSCTVAGATWGSRGRTFDGANDIITVAAHASFSDLFNGGGTIAAWINPSSDGEGNAGKIACTYDTAQGTKGWVFEVREEAASKVKLRFVMFQTGPNYGDWRTTATEVDINTFSHVAVTYDESNNANDPIFYVNGGAVVNSEAHAPAGAPETESNNLIIGNYANTTATFDGIVGGVCGHNRILSGAELLAICNVTRRTYEACWDFFTWA